VQILSHDEWWCQQQWQFLSLCIGTLQYYSSPVHSLTFVFIPHCRNAGRGFKGEGLKLRTIAFVWAIFIDVPVNNHFDTIIFIILYSWLRYLNKINLVTGGDASIWMSSYELTRRIAVLLHVAVDDEERACIWYGTVSICLYFLILFTIIITKELAACILHHSSMMHAEQ
jgi:hypothetical protein